MYARKVRMEGATHMGPTKAIPLQIPMFFLPYTSTIFKHISIDHSHILRPPVYIFTAMSTHNSPKPSLESLRKRLDSLHKIRYNLDAHFISIRQDLGEIIMQHLETGNVVYRLLLGRAYYLRQYAAHMSHLQVPEVDVGISTGRQCLEELETRMSEMMKILMDLREISEFE